VRPTKVPEKLIMAMIDHVLRMKPKPVSVWGQWHQVPGTYSDGMFLITVEEDPAWEKVDKLILQTLKTLKDDKFAHPLQTLANDVCNSCIEMGGGVESGAFLLGSRMLEDVDQVAALSLMARLVKDNEDMPEYLRVFLGIHPDVALKNLGRTLTRRGLLKKRKAG